MSRRVNGEGWVSAKPRADGLWVARYSIVEDGKMRRPALYARTRAGVAQKLRDAIAAKERGERTPTSESVAEYLTTWHEGSRTRLRDSSWRRDGDQIRVHLVPQLGHHKLRKLGPEHISSAYARLLAKGLAPATVRRIHAVLHSALAQAVRWRTLPSNPASLVDLPRIPHLEMTALSQEQARELLAAAEGHRLEALLVVAVTTGMRQGELLALRWADVDLEAGWLRVTGTLTRKSTGESSSTTSVITEPKTRSGRRRVELTEFAREILRRHRAEQLEEHIAAANLWADRGLVFCNYTGGFLQPTKIGAQFHELLAGAGLPRIRFHDLRHTAATLMLGRGVHPKVAAEMLGHSSVGITMDLYSHVSPTMQREAVAIMDDVFR